MNKKNTRKERGWECAHSIPIRNYDVLQWLDSPQCNSHKCSSKNWMLVSSDWLSTNKIEYCLNQWVSQSASDNSEMRTKKLGRCAKCACFELLCTDEPKWQSMQRNSFILLIGCQYSCCVRAVALPLTAHCLWLVHARPFIRLSLSASLVRYVFILFRLVSLCAKKRGDKERENVF